MIMIYLGGDGPGGGGALLDWDINTNLNISCDTILAYKVKCDLSWNIVAVLRRDGVTGLAGNGVTLGPRSKGVKTSL